MTTKIPAEVIGTWISVALVCFLLAFAPGMQSQPRVALARTMSSRVDVFRTPNQQAFTLVHTPSPDGAVLVFLNGMLQLADEDYTIAGADLTFTKQTIGDAPIIQVQYWTAQAWTQ